MTTIRKFCCHDLLGFASVTLDHLTLTREMSVYLKWLSTWPDYCNVAIAPGKRIIGYFLGADKEDTEGGHWRGFAMVVTVASQYRRQKLATKLMRLFDKEMVKKMRAEPRDDHYYVFLYVGVYNNPAIYMFKKLGYKVHTRIPKFYSKDGEDAYEMIKEVAEERLPRVIQLPAVCSSCKKTKSQTCSYVCLPPIL